MSKEDLSNRQQKAHDDSMSLQWNSRAREIDSVRPAGDGPLMQEFYAQVAREMRAQERAELERMWNFSEKTARAQRGRNWRVWITWFAVGFAGGAFGALIAHLTH